MEGAIGNLKITILQGANLAVRDMLSSDPYIVVSLGEQVNFFSVFPFNGDYLTREWTTTTITESGYTYVLSCSIYMILNIIMMLFCSWCRDIAGCGSQSY